MCFSRILSPKQFGYFVDTDEDKAGKSGIVSIMENLIDKVIIIFESYAIIKK